MSIDTNNNMHCVCMLHTHASTIDNGHIDLPEMLSWIQYTTVGSNTVLPWSICLHFENDSVICRIFLDEDVMSLRLRMDLQYKGQINDNGLKVISVSKST